MVIMGQSHYMGRFGLPLDHSKAFELFQRAIQLGSAAGHYKVGYSYNEGKGTIMDTENAVHHWKIAAMMGNSYARHNLGIAYYNNGNHQVAMRHFMIAAKCGLKGSLANVMKGFSKGYVTKEELEKTLRGYQSSCDETKSEQRDRGAIIQARQSELMQTMETSSLR
eukprot:scaffold17798_cov22-Cyclotella_meneghiniana.AAC.1